MNTISGPLDSSATRSACCRPTVRGATPMTTNDTTSEMPIAASIASQRPSVTAGPASAPPRRTITSSITTVTSTIAVISQSIRSSSAVLR